MTVNLVRSFERTSHLRYVTDTNGVVYILSELIHHTTTSIKYLLKEAVHLADGLGVGVILDDFQFALSAVRFEGRWKPFGHHLLDIYIGARPRFQVDGIPVVDEVVGGSVMMDFEQKT